MGINCFNFNKSNSSVHSKKGSSTSKGICECTHFHSGKCPCECEKCTKYFNSNYAGYGFHTAFGVPDSAITLREGKKNILGQPNNGRKIKM